MDIKKAGCAVQSSARKRWSMLTKSFSRTYTRRQKAC